MNFTNELMSLSYPLFDSTSSRISDTALLNALVSASIALKSEASSLHVTSICLQFSMLVVLSVTEPARFAWIFAKSFFNRSFF
ncbi:hypothetical protein Poly51_60140 [Rubripirellula tenax]|uniref:Uncharacterized protein n=1 Tax=Rubripirellula tenax TaxID=2528015 RepID=A0A5C6E4K2_9BACT|nr:hypothetical protein Poly51_60140 [Rubripirellula tenax]